MRKAIEQTSVTDEAVAAISVSHLLHPASHFAHPNDVLAATNLDIQEKRAILASWASDQFAVESIPALRQYPGTERAVTYDEVLTALKALDREQTLQNHAMDSDDVRRLDLRCLIPLRRRHRIGRRGT